MPTLGHAGDRRSGPFDRFQRGHGDLGVGVGGGDRPGDRFECGPGERHGELGQMRSDPIHGVGATDDTGRCDQHVLGPAADGPGNSRREFLGVGASLSPRGHVGVLRHDDEPSQRAVGHVFPGDLDAGTSEARSGEHRRCGHRSLSGHDHEVRRVVLDTDVGHVGAESVRQVHAGSLAEPVEVATFDQPG